MIRSDNIPSRTGHGRCNHGDIKKNPIQIAKNEENRTGTGADSEREKKTRSGAGKETTSTGRERGEKKSRRSMRRNRKRRYRKNPPRRRNGETKETARNAPRRKSTGCGASRDLQSKKGLELDREILSGKEKKHHKEIRHMGKKRPDYENVSEL